MRYGASTAAVARDATGANSWRQDGSGAIDGKELKVVMEKVGHGGG